MELVCVRVAMVICDGCAGYGFEEGSKIRKENIEAL